MDALAVAIAAGIHLKSVNIRQRFRLSWHFGLFQALMPVLGWYSGKSIYSVIAKFDHWLAFGLLAFVGINMIREFLHDKPAHHSIKDPTKGHTLIFLSFSTSIDALAVGISMAMLNIQIFLPALIIGMVATLFTLVGLEAGSKISIHTRLAPYAHLIGGIILLIIGVNILFENGF
jgi:putative Mn2+ efflux pump MntP